MCKKVSGVEEGDKEDEIAIGKRKMEPHSHHGPCCEGWAV